MKPLEALWKIDHTICMNFNDKRIKWNIDKPEDYPDGGYDEKDTDCKSFNNFCECYDEIEKSLKALEIIVKKGVAVGMLQLKEVGVKEYNDFIGDTKLYLTQEEYDFLKEYLL